MICIGLHHCQHFLAGTERRSRSTRWQWGPWGGASGRLAATARYLGLPTGPTCRVVGVRGPVGMAGLYGLAGAQRPWPSARPRTDASTPSHSASLSSKVATSAGDAPSVRARAESARRSRSRLHSAMDVVRNNFPYLHRRIWAHSVVARRLGRYWLGRLALGWGRIARWCYARHAHAIVRSNLRWQHLSRLCQSHGHHRSLERPVSGPAPQNGGASGCAVAATQGRDAVDQRQPGSGAVRQPWHRACHGLARCAA